MQPQNEKHKAQPTYQFIQVPISFKRCAQCALEKRKEMGCKQHLNFLWLLFSFDFTVFPTLYFQNFSKLLQIVNQIRMSVFNLWNLSKQKGNFWEHFFGAYLPYANLLSLWWSPNVSQSRRDTFMPSTVVQEFSKTCKNWFLSYF